MTTPEGPPDERPKPAEFEAPVILDRGHHRISRRDIDPDCLKVLYRLSHHGFVAYLVGGAVRDLLLGRRPADFDVGTNAHPNQIKKLFRNAYLIGRRFRLAQVRFQGGKVIEVSTFRRKPTEEELAAEREEEARLAREAERRELGPGPEAIGQALEAQGALAPKGPQEEGAEGGPDGQEEAVEAGGPVGVGPEAAPGAGGEAGEREGAAEERRVEGRRGRPRPPLKPIAYGTPREDAFRRDLTINALFYDIATFSVIDYVGGLADLERGLIRLIGEPDERIVEDPVRIWRVLRHASRLDFAIEEATAAAVEGRRDLLRTASGARLYEELNKDLKSGSARPFFQRARTYGVLSPILGDVGRLYEYSDDRFEKLTTLLGSLDALVASAGPAPRPEMAYGLLLWPWAEPLLAEMTGDKPSLLAEAFRSAKPAVLVPRALLVETVHILVMVDHMIRALIDGRMRWSLRSRPRYPEASRLVSLLVEGSFGEGDDPFSAIYQRRFGARPGRPRRRRRRFKKPRPPSA